RRGMQLSRVQTGMRGRREIFQGNAPVSADAGENGGIHSNGNSHIPSSASFRANALRNFQPAVRHHLRLAGGAMDETADVPIPDRGENSLSGRERLEKTSKAVQIKL